MQSIRFRSRRSWIDSNLQPAADAYVSAGGRRRISSAPTRGAAAASGPVSRMDPQGSDGPRRVRAAASSANEREDGGRRKRRRKTDIPRARPPQDVRCGSPSSEGTCARGDGVRSKSNALEGRGKERAALAATVPLPADVISLVESPNFWTSLAQMETDRLAPGRRRRRASRTERARAADRATRSRSSSMSSSGGETDSEWH